METIKLQPTDNPDKWDVRTEATGILVGTIHRKENRYIAQGGGYIPPIGFLKIESAFECFARPDKFTIKGHHA